MNALILAAGYGTRLYPLTLFCAKPLLPVGDRPLIDHLLRRLQPLAGLVEVVVVTNARFGPQFIGWRAGVRFPRPVRVLDDGTTSNAARLGAIGDIAFVLRHRPDLTGPLLVIAGDNLFTWPLAAFAREAARRAPAATVGVWRVQDRSLLRRYGTVRLGPGGRVTQFREKSPQPCSLLASTGIYYFPPAVLGLLRTYLSGGGRADMPGHFLEWLIHRHPASGHVFRGLWYDIGDLSSYHRASRAFAHR